MYIRTSARDGCAEGGPEQLHASAAPGLLLDQRFWLSGPYVDRPSYDSVAQALSGAGAWSITAGRSLGPALADAITGLYASQGMLGALVQRGRTGKGCHVEISMLEAMAHFAVEPFAAFFALDQVPTSADRPRLAQAYILRTADERLIAIHLSSLEKFWKGLTVALEAPELATDPRFNPRERRIAEYETLRLELDARFARRRWRTGCSACRLRCPARPRQPHR